MCFTWERLLEDGALAMGREYKKLNFLESPLNILPFFIEYRSRAREGENNACCKGGSSYRWICLQMQVL